MRFGVSIFLLVPIVLTVLAWIEGIRANGKAEPVPYVGTRTWPAMLFLAGPVLMLFGLVGLRMWNLTHPTFPVWMFFTGGASSMAALVASTWSAPGFRPIAFFAALGWVACFGLGLLMLSALSGLR